MKRRNFIKALAAACAVPAVAARAIASHRKKPTDAEIDDCLRSVFRASDEDVDDFCGSLRDEYGAWYDQSGNGNHLRIIQDPHLTH